MEYHLLKDDFKYMLDIYNGGQTVKTPLQAQKWPKLRKRSLNSQAGEGERPCLVGDLYKELSAEQEASLRIGERVFEENSQEHIFKNDFSYSYWPSNEGIIRFTRFVYHDPSIEAVLTGLFLAIKCKFERELTERIRSEVSDSVRKGYKNTVLGCHIQNHPEVVKQFEANCPGDQVIFDLLKQYFFDCDMIDSLGAKYKIAEKKYRAVWLTWLFAETGSDASQKLYFEALNSPAVKQFFDKCWEYIDLLEELNSKYEIYLNLFREYYHRKNQEQCTVSQITQAIAEVVKEYEVKRLEYLQYYQLLVQVGIIELPIQKEPSVASPVGVDKSKDIVKRNFGLCFHLYEFIKRDDKHSVEATEEMNFLHQIIMEYYDGDKPDYCEEEYYLIEGAYTVMKGYADERRMVKRPVDPDLANGQVSAKATMSLQIKLVKLKVSEVSRCIERMEGLIDRLSVNDGLSDIEKTKAYYEDILRDEMCEIELEMERLKKIEAQYKDRVDGVTGNG